jgi:hypothetical protein
MDIGFLFILLGQMKIDCREVEIIMSQPIEKLRENAISTVIGDSPV